MAAERAPGDRRPIRTDLTNFFLFGCKQVIRRQNLLAKKNTQKRERFASVGATSRCYRFVCAGYDRSVTGLAVHRSKDARRALLGGRTADRTVTAPRSMVAFAAGDTMRITEDLLLIAN